MKIFEYHRFTHYPDPYQYSRTYADFLRDIQDSKPDLVTMDDGWISQIRACELLRERNIRPVLGIITDYIGKEGYMDWDDLKYLVHFCDIANHTHTHPHLIDGMNECQIRWQIRRANKILEDQLSVEIFYKPRYFIPPYDQLTESIKIIAEEERLRVIEGRIVILNTTK